MAWAEPGLSPNSKPPPQLKRPRTYVTARTFKSTVHRVQLKDLLLSVLLFSTSLQLVQSIPPKPARAPLLSGQPFIIFWGIPDSSCSSRPDLGSFGMEQEGRVTVFYEDTLGNYPYFVDRDTPVNSGLPQYTRLDDHLRKTREDLVAALPAPRYLGLGVLRWAEWAPQWLRNREKQKVYLDASRALLKAFFPNWTPEQVEKWSQVDFEAAAQSILIETLLEVQRLRPKALWGVSPYPSCNNADPTQTPLANYTGKCPAAEMAFNNELQWLWKRCSALYPLLTLEKLQGGTSGSRLYWSNQIREALRVASLAGTVYDLPVFPLVKSVYVATNTFLSQADLVNTVGESAAMGAAGVVIWEKDETKTERECSDLAEFVHQVLGPYSINVTTASRLCSSSLCQGRGRCIRQNPESAAYLHLPSPSNVVEKVESAKTTVLPETAVKPDSPDPAEIWKKDFQCQWFETPDGAISDQQSPKDGAPVGGLGIIKAGDLTEPTGSSPVKSVSVDELGRSTTSGTQSPKPSMEVPRDHGTKPPSAWILSVLLLLVIRVFCLET